MRYLFLLLFISGTASAQLKKYPRVQQTTEDSVVVDNGKKDSLKIYKPNISDYQYQTEFSELVVFDTLFDIHKYYAKTQYNNQDNFGSVAFANIGAGFQELVYRTNPEQNLSLLPQRKAIFLTPISEVRYYDVKTPTTSFMYHNAVNNGAALKSTYTQNIGKNFNFAVEYMGLRSQGKYKYSLAVNSHFLVTAHFLSKSNRYEFFAHYLHENSNHQENGGIQDLNLFTSSDSRFKSRENLEVNLIGTDSRFSYRRYYFSQSLALFDKDKFPLKLRHSIYHQGNKYYINLGTTDASELGTLLPDRILTSKKYSDNLSNIFGLEFQKKNWHINAGLKYQNLKFGVENQGLKPTNDAVLTENRLGAVGNIKLAIDQKYTLASDIEYSVGKAFGHFIRSANLLKLEPLKGYFLNAEANFQTVAPSFNYLLNASPLVQYNYNFKDFKNENSLELAATLGVKWFQTNLFAKFFRLGNFTYFTSAQQPAQSETPLNITQLGGDTTFDYGKFHLNTRVLFQKNLTNQDLLPIPNIIARSNLYFQSKAFKNAAEIMVGIGVYYFSSFASRSFSPILNAFVLPGDKTYAIGARPIANAFFNLKVKSFQLFLEAQNFSTTFTANRSYTAPYYPIGDFRLNIGIEWLMFH